MSAFRVTCTARSALLSAEGSGRNISEVICGLADTTRLPARPTIIETHTFTFADLAHTSAYLATCPQYPLPDQLRRPEALAAELHARLPDGPVTTTATITYVLARPTERTP